VSTVAEPEQNPSFVPEAVVLGAARQINELPYAVDPQIAVNPLNPDHLAAAMFTLPVPICDSSGCDESSAFYTSTDGGTTWSEQTPFRESRQSMRWGRVAFAADGTLYMFAIRGNREQRTINSSTADNGPLPYEMSPANASVISGTQLRSSPWLQIHPQSGELFFSYSSRDQDRVSFGFKRSADGGATWSSSIRPDEGINAYDVMNGRAAASQDTQVLFGQGDELAAVWTWSSDIDRLPVGVWMATSSDDGATFSQAQQIAETWGSIKTLSHNGSYFIFYRTGSEQVQEWAVAISPDNGISWTSTSVSNGIPLYLGKQQDALGVGIAPNGTIDVVFSAPGENGPACGLDLEAWRNLHIISDDWIDDTCPYDVYYTFSPDSGRSFSQPQRLNEASIRGDQFVIWNRYSALGAPGIASTDAYAYPMWIEARSEAGTQVYTMRIER